MDSALQDDNKQQNVNLLSICSALSTIADFEKDHNKKIPKNNCYEFYDSFDRL